MTAQELFDKYSYVALRGDWAKRYKVMNQKMFTAALAEALEGGHLQPVVSLSEQPPEAAVCERQENADDGSCNHIVSYSEGVDESWLDYNHDTVAQCYVEIEFKYCPLCGKKLVG